MSAKIRKAAAILTEQTGEEWTPAQVQETIWSWAKTLVELAESQGETAEAMLRTGNLTDEAIASTPDFAALLSTNPTIRDI